MVDSEAGATGLKRRRLSRHRYGLAGLILLVVSVVLAACVLANHRVVAVSQPYIFTELDTLPVNTVGLVLGTSTYTRSGNQNLLFEYRIDAATELFRAGKVQRLLVSGSNPDASYNEPRKMYQALVSRGVPPEAIRMDFAGFRTLDSVVRAAEVFGLRSFTIISQRFHDYRAVYIARSKGLEVVAYAAPERTEQQLPRTWWREFFARVRAVLDVHLLGTQPRFLGEPLEIAPLPGAKGSYDSVEETETDDR